MKPIEINGIEIQQYENDNEVNETPPMIITCKSIADGPAISPGATETTCYACKRPIWISPSSVAAVKAAPKVLVLCYPCTREATAVLKSFNREIRLASLPRKEETND